MKKFYLLPLLTLGVFSAMAQNITLTPSEAVLEGDPSVIQEVHIDFVNNGSNQTMTWMRTMNDIPDYWTSSVCDFNLCWAPNADEPGYYFDAPADTEGTVYVKFDARNFHDGAFDPVPGCGMVEVVFYSVLDSANYNAVALFTAYLGVSQEECSFNVISPVKENSFAVYPNPAINSLNVLASMSANVSKVDIVNIVGHSVAQYTWSTSNGKMNFDITELPQGIYFVRLIDTAGKAVYTEKVSVLQ